MVAGWVNLQELVKERLGLDLSRRDPSWFVQLLEEQARATGLSDGTEYLRRLDQSDCDSDLWTTLIDRLTIAETYFFRDEGQMALLRDQLLRGLLKEASGRGLRIWSAGCSTGEELYTIAMLLDAMAAPPADLLGTDLNPEVIEQARQGVYRERSLRNLPGSLRALYLEPRGQRFAIASRLRQRTRFRVGNLCSDDTSLLRGLDLIVCRNVLIYLDRARLPEILDRFYACLRPGGLLLTGHGELLAVETPFEVVPYPSSLVYRRPELAFTAPRSQEPSAAGAFSQHQPPSAPAPEPPEDSRLEQLLSDARAARLRGAVTEARAALRQALYLDPDYAAAYLELALLVAADDPERARKHRATGLDLIELRPTLGQSQQVRRALAELDRSLP